MDTPDEGLDAEIVDAPDHHTTLEDTRRASRQSDWDVDIYTAASLDRIKQTAIRDFESTDAISPELAQKLIDCGYFTASQPRTRRSGASPAQSVAAARIAPAEPVTHSTATPRDRKRPHVLWIGLFGSVKKRFRRLILSLSSR